MYEITAPRISVNDTTCTLLERYVQNGDHVEKDEALASLGSSKTVVELTAPAAGYIAFLCNASDEIATGSPIARLFATQEEYTAYVAQSAQPQTTPDTDDEPYILTTPAQKFALAKAIPPEAIRTLHKKIVTKADLEQLLQQTAQEELSCQHLSFNQIQTANAVSQAHREIPQAFHLSKVDCSACETFIQNFSQQHGVPIGYGEICTVILAELFTEFPTLYSHYVKDNTIALAKFPKIGITIDAGNGLFMPVVRCDKHYSLEEITEILFSYKLKALDNSFEASELSGGNISISINPEKNIISVVPIIFPGQAAILSVCSPVTELCFDENRTVIEKRFLYLGLAFDHRLINGSTAMHFLRRISENIENVSFLNQHPQRESS